MKQEKARKIQENNFEIENEIRGKLNKKIIEKLLERSYGNPNPNVSGLRNKLEIIYNSNFK